MGPWGVIGAHGENGGKGDTGDVGQQGPICSQGSTGPSVVQIAKRLRGIVGIQGSPEVQGPVGSTGGKGDRGPKGDLGAPAVEIDVVAELCKHLPIGIVEQYRPGTYARYAINSMKDIELHGAARVKAIIDKDGHCNASQSDVRRMATLSKTQVNSNYVLNFYNDAYNMEADIHNFHYFCVFLVYKITAYAKTEHW